MLASIAMLKTADAEQASHKSNLCAKSDHMTNEPKNPWYPENQNQEVYVQKEKSAFEKRLDAAREIRSNSIFEKELYFRSACLGITVSLVGLPL